MVPKLKVLRIYWNLAQLIFRISRSRFWCQKLFLLNVYHLFGPNCSQNEKYSEFIETWHIRYFKYANLDFDVKNDFYKIFTICSAQIVPKIKSTQNLLKFGTFHISNIPISILMSKIIFIKYLPLVRPRLFPILKVLRIHWNLAHSTFQTCQSRFWCQKWFLLNIYHLLYPNWFQN